MSNTFTPEIASDAAERLDSAVDSLFAVQQMITAIMLEENNDTYHDNLACGVSNLMQGIIDEMKSAAHTLHIASCPKSATPSLKQVR
jgi:hypothetical protein